jgi:hypothetical protein
MKDLEEKGDMRRKWVYISQDKSKDPYISYSFTQSSIIKRL